MIAVLAAVAVVAGGTYAYLEYERGVSGAADMKPVATVTAGELLSAYTADAAAADQRFVGSAEQAIRVTGTIRAMEPVGSDKTNVILETGDPMAGVVCEFTNTDLPPDWRSGAEVSVQGICTGMQQGDDLLELLGSDVVLVRCSGVE
jgi:hypothetical protein